MNYSMLRQILTFWLKNISAFTSGKLKTLIIRSNDDDDDNDDDIHHHHCIHFTIMIIS
jgi:hypothetical protein